MIIITPVQPRPCAIDVQARETLCACPRTRVYMRDDERGGGRGAHFTPQRAPTSPDVDDCHVESAYFRRRSACIYALSSMQRGPV